MHESQATNGSFTLFSPAQTSFKFTYDKGQTEVGQVLPDIVTRENGAARFGVLHRTCQRLRRIKTRPTSAHIHGETWEMLLHGTTDHTQ